MADAMPITPTPLMEAAEVRLKTVFLLLHKMGLVTIKIQYKLSLENWQNKLSVKYLAHKLKKLKYFT